MGGYEKIKKSHQCTLLEFLSLLDPGEIPKVFSCNFLAKRFQVYHVSEAGEGRAENDETCVEENDDQPATNTATSSSSIKTPTPGRGYYLNQRPMLKSFFVRKRLSTNRKINYSAEEVQRYNSLLSEIDLKKIAYPTHTHYRAPYTNECFPRLHRFQDWKDVKKFGRYLDKSVCITNEQINLNYFVQWANRGSDANGSSTSECKNSSKTLESKTGATSTESNARDIEFIDLCRENFENDTSLNLLTKKRTAALEKVTCHANLEYRLPETCRPKASTPKSIVKLPKNNYSNEEFTTKTVESVSIRQPVRVDDMRHSDILAVDDFGDPLFLSLNRNKLMVRKDEVRQGKKKGRK